jgi:hypothetical protein
MVKQWEHNGTEHGRRNIGQHGKASNGKTMEKQWDRTRLRHKYLPPENRVEQGENNGKLIGKQWDVISRQHGTTMGRQWENIGT